MVRTAALQNIFKNLATGRRQVLDCLVNGVICSFPYTKHPLHPSISPSPRSLWFLGLTRRDQNLHNKDKSSTVLHERSKAKPCIIEPLIGQQSCASGHNQEVTPDTSSHHPQPTAQKYRGLAYPWLNSRARRKKGGEDCVITVSQNFGTLNFNDSFKILTFDHLANAQDSKILNH